MKAACLALAVCFLLPSAVNASVNEHYLTLGGQYLPVAAGDDTFHTPSLTLGYGYFVSDFAVLEADLFYGGLPSDGAYRQFAGSHAAFRLLIDATQWVPSVGAIAGWLAAHATDTGLESGAPYAGFSLCLERRTAREKSLSACAEGASFPFSDEFQSVYFLNLNFNGYLPYFFE